MVLNSRKVIFYDDTRLQLTCLPESGANSLISILAPA